MFPKPQHERRKPKQWKRNNITKEEYRNALDHFGDSCVICNAQPIEMHHVVFRSSQGRGVYRNLFPLCKGHHLFAHEDRKFADYLREMKVENHGEHYYKDMYDLYEEGLIEEATQQHYENFMKSEELK